MPKKEKIFNRIEEIVGIALLAFILVILTYQVILRFIFKNSNAWSEELSRYLFVWFVYISASYAITKKAHIKIDALMNIYPAKLRKYISLIGNIIFLVYTVAVTLFSARFTMDIYRAGQISLGLRVKMAYIYAAIPIAHFFMAIRLISQIYGDLFSKKVREEAIEE